MLTLKPSYLETLPTGEHKLTVYFMADDVKSAETRFIIAEKSSGDSPEEKEPKKKEPEKTDNVVTCQMAGYPANYVWNEAAKACQAGYIDDKGVFHSTAS